MLFKFKKGKHRPIPPYWLRWFPVLFKRKVSRTVTFYGEYRVDGVDQYDINKLFGISSMMVHRNSHRFGWRFEPDMGEFLVYQYSYVNGVRSFYPITYIKPGVAATMTISIVGDDAIFEVLLPGSFLKTRTIKSGRLGWPCFLMGPYFGGNNPAPSDWTMIRMEKLKVN